MYGIEKSKGVKCLAGVGRLAYTKAGRKSMLSQFLHLEELALITPRGSRKNTLKAVNNQAVNFHTYNDERLKHTELYKNYTEDYVADAT
uniref:Uncharacterized protein n=1 Tax=Romanomermis culicivorax TaxID=13658 RepID=A0A915KIA5_ROMCU